MTPLLNHQASFEAYMLSHIQHRHPHALDATEIIHLKTCWNGTLPIARLPPELLSTIFVAYATSIREDYTLSWRDVQPYLWVQVTHVCRYWRDVAIDCAVLWNWVVPASVACTQTILSRSRSAPLIINLNTQLLGRTRVLSDPKAVNIVYKQWAHIAEARIDVPHPALRNISAPILRSLDVRSWCSDENALDAEPLFHSSCAPPLRYIRWSGGLQWHSLAPLLGPKVEELRVTPTFSSITVETWCSVLQNMPQLRVLSLDGAVYCDPLRGLSVDSSTVKQRVALPCLQKLLLSANTSILGEACLLTRLSIPPDTDVNLSTYFVPSVTGDEARILAHSVVAATSNRHIDELTLWRQDHTFFRPRTTLRWVLSSLSTPADVVIEVRVDYTEVDRTTIDISSGLPLSEVTSISLALGDLDTEAFGVKALSAAFGKMTKLQKVVGKGYSGLVLPEAFPSAKPLRASG
ncbi:hypothetical protein EIP86_001664 [Pleurotus ostreatoroseus]|nr:hypothetical protein EIP86_001664 [Pleurotus ostreatoroseus]